VTNIDNTMKKNIDEREVVDILRDIPKRQGQSNDGEPYCRYELIKTYLREDLNLVIRSNVSIRYLDELFLSNGKDRNILVNGYLKLKWDLKPCVQILRSGFLKKECNNPESELIKKIELGKVKRTDAIVEFLSNKYDGYTHYQIYLIEFIHPFTKESTNFYKYGLTKDLDSRVLSYETSNPFTQRLVDTWSCKKMDCYEIERDIKTWGNRVGSYHKGEFLYYEEGCESLRGEINGIISYVTPVKGQQLTFDMAY